MPKAKRKKITTDEIARMIKKGFDSAATKQDIKILGTKIVALEAEVKVGFKEVKAEIKHIRSYTEKTFRKLDEFLARLTTLEQEQAVMKGQLDRLRERIEKIETHLGIQ